MDFFFEAFGVGKKFVVQRVVYVVLVKDQFGEATAHCSTCFCNHYVRLVI